MRATLVTPPDTAACKLIAGPFCLGRVTNDMADKESRCYGRCGTFKSKAAAAVQRGIHKISTGDLSLLKARLKYPQDDITGAPILDCTSSTQWLQSLSLRQSPRPYYRRSLQTTCHSTKLMTMSTGMSATPNKPQHIMYRAWGSKESRTEGLRPVPRR